MLKQKRAAKTICVLYFTTHNFLLNNSQQIWPNNTDQMAEEIQKETSVMHESFTQAGAVGRRDTCQSSTQVSWNVAQVQEINSKESKV